MQHPPVPHTQELSGWERLTQSCQPLAHFDVAQDTLQGL